MNDLSCPEDRVLVLESVPGQWTNASLHDSRQIDAHRSRDVERVVKKVLAYAGTIL